MKLADIKIAELRAEQDWLQWKIEEDIRFTNTGTSEFHYAEGETADKDSDVKRIDEIKSLLDACGGCCNG